MPAVNNYRTVRFISVPILILSLCVAFSYFGTVSADSHVSLHITREEFCVLLSNTFFEPQALPADTSSNPPPFSDIADISQDALPHILLLLDKNLIQGFSVDDSIQMRPKAFITRQDALTLLGRLIGKTSDNPPPFIDSDSISDYALPYISWFAENAAILNTDSFYPADLLSLDDASALTAAAFAILSRGSVPITTIAGTGNRGFDNGLAATFGLPNAVIAAPNGDIFVLDTYNNLIRSISANGSTSTIAGFVHAYDENRFPRGYYVDASLDKALLNRPTSAVSDSNGRIFFTDSGNSVIRVLDNDKIYTFCGSVPGFADGTGNQAQFNWPSAIAIDGDDNLYVADTLNNCIRKITPQAVVTTIAGVPASEGFLDAPANEALFREPSGIAVSQDASRIYIADTGNHKIRLLLDNSISTFAGFTDSVDEDDYPLGGFRDASASDSMFRLPVGLHLINDILLVADSGNNRIRAIINNSVSTIAGSGEPGDSTIDPDSDISALLSDLHHPMGIFYQDSTLFIVDTGNNKIKSMPFDPSLYSPGR